MLAKPTTNDIKEQDNDEFPDLPNEQDEDIKQNNNPYPKKDEHKMTINNGTFANKQPTAFAFGSLARVNEFHLSPSSFSYCDIYGIFNQVQFTYGKLFIDIRPKSEFKKQKIYQFINLPCQLLDDPDCDEKLIDQLMNSKRSKFEHPTHSYFNVANIIYIVSNKEIIDNKKDIQFCEYLQNLLLDVYDQHLPIIAVNNPFNNFCEKFPFLCYRQFPYDIAKYPSQIINDELFLGNMSDATDKEVLMDLKITHIINMTPRFTCQMFDVDPELKIKYLQCPIYDSDEVNIQKYFEKGIAFISRALDKNENGKIKHSVLVHCQAGVSRSASMIIAYLMKVKQMSFINAYKYTQDRREIIEPNDGFVKQLKLYEKNIND